MDAVLLALCMAMTLAGCMLGMFSGIMPGIHVNTLSAILLSSYPVIQEPLSGLVGDEGSIMSMCCCVMAASVVHSFVDFVPSVFIGAPDSEDAISILPGHRLLLEGRGMDAVKSAATGSLVGACSAIVLAIPLQMVMSTEIGDSIDGLAWTMALIASSIIMLGCGHGVVARIWGLAAFCISGILGLMVDVLEIPCEGLLGEGTPMFPMLTGLFGIPVLLSGSGSSGIPRQMPAYDGDRGIMPGLRGVVMGCVSGWFPGITSTVGASMSSCVFRERNPEDFIANVASIGTVTSVLSIVALSVSGSGRSGTAIVLRDLSGDMLYGVASSTFVLLLLATAVSSLIGYWMTIASGRAMSSLVPRIDTGMMNRAVLVLNVILVLLLTGPFGIIILVVSTLIGLLPESSCTSRIVLCGCLLMPVLLQTI